MAWPLLHSLLALVAPPRYALCAGSCRADAHLCGGCEARLTRLPAQLAPVAGVGLVWSAAPYEGVARDLVTTLKFGARLSLAERAAAAMVERAPAELLDGTIVPVPPAPWRRRRRGFDPAEAIAVALAVEAGIPLRRCLRRTQGRRQVGRPRAERLANPPRVRLVQPPPPRVILVDDVVTTGATLCACARALHSGGASRVAALTFARSGG